MTELTRNRIERKPTQVTLDMLENIRRHTQISRLINNDVGSIVEFDEERDIKILKFSDGSLIKYDKPYITDYQGKKLHYNRRSIANEIKVYTCGEFKREDVQKISSIINHYKLNSDNSISAIINISSGNGSIKILSCVSYIELFDAIYSDLKKHSKFFLVDHVCV
jgi:hypothetical protein